MLFGIIGRTGPGMRQVVKFGDRSTGRGTFGEKFGAHHCNQWGLYGDAALFPNYFGQTCFRSIQSIKVQLIINYFTNVYESCKVYEAKGRR